MMITTMIKNFNSAQSEIFLQILIEKESFFIIFSKFFTLLMDFYYKEGKIMAVKIGQSYVSEAVANFAKNSADNGDNVLKSLRKNF